MIMVERLDEAVTGGTATEAPNIAAEIFWDYLTLWRRVGRGYIGQQDALKLFGFFATGCQHWIPSLTW